MTVPEPAGPAVMVFAVFDFGWLSLVVGIAAMRTDWGADRLLSGRRRGCLNADRLTLRRMSLLLADPKNLLGLEVVGGEETV